MYRAVRVKLTWQEKREVHAIVNDPYEVGEAVDKLIKQYMTGNSEQVVIQSVQVTCDEA